MKPKLGLRGGGGLEKRLCNKTWATNNCTVYFIRIFANIYCHVLYTVMLDCIYGNVIYTVILYTVMYMATIDCSLFYTVISKQFDFYHLFQLSNFMFIRLAFIRESLILPVFTFTATFYKVTFYSIAF